MFERIVLNGSPAGDCAWQTTLCLLLGAVAALVLSARPARAHRALVLGILGW